MRGPGGRAGAGRGQRRDQPGGCNYHLIPLGQSLSAIAQVEVVCKYSTSSLKGLLQESKGNNSRIVGIYCRQSIPSARDMLMTGI